MQFPSPLVETTLLRRYKRFLADVEMPNGNVVTVHCPNPGAMTGLDRPGSRAWISDSGNPGRKLRCTLELVETGDTLAGVNTGSANRLAREAMGMGLVNGIPAASGLKSECRYGSNSRIDFLVDTGSGPDVHVEVKSVTLVRQPGLHEFPDSVTGRGARHMAELAEVAASGGRAMLLFIVQRNDGDRLAVAGDIDPAYERAFRLAREAGVEMRAICCEVSPTGIVPARAIEVLSQPH